MKGIEVTVPKFRSSWTDQMATWLVRMTQDMEVDDPTEGVISPGPTAQDWIENHWEEICDSWKDKNKWNRVWNCLRYLPWIGDDPEFAKRMNRAAECWSKGHVIVDVSSAGPDSGNMDTECARCGRYFSQPLY